MVSLSIEDINNQYLEEICSFTINILIFCYISIHAINKHVTLDSCSDHVCRQTERRYPTTDLYFWIAFRCRRVWYLTSKCILLDSNVCGKNNEITRVLIKDSICNSFISYLWLPYHYEPYFHLLTIFLSSYNYLLAAGDAIHCVHNYCCGNISVYYSKAWYGHGIFNGVWLCYSLCRIDALLFDSSLGSSQHVFDDKCRHYTDPCRFSVHGRYGQLSCALRDIIVDTILNLFFSSFPYTKYVVSLLLWNSHVRI